MAGGCIEERNSRVIQLFHSGMLRIDIASSVGVSPARISQIIKGHTRPRSKKRRNNYWTTRADEMVALYQCGFSLYEIAARMGTHKELVCITLQGHPDYRPRVGGRPPKAIREFEVPGWVSAEWQPRYRLIAQRHGEYVAASCIRTAKRLGVSA